MKLKNSEIIAATERINSIIERKFNKKFSYALTRNAILMKPVIEAFTKEREKILDECNKKDENGEPAYKKTGQIEIAKEHESQWKKELGELLEIEVDFEPHMIGIEDIPDEIEPSVLLALDFMISE